jgi:hypothetical protein
MTDNRPKRKRGRPTERPNAKRIGFYVSEADHAWLSALPNRSAWLAEKVAAARHTSALDSAATPTERSGARPDAE